MKNIHKGSMILWIVVGVVVLFIIAAGVYLYQNKNSNNPNTVSAVGNGPITQSKCLPSDLASIDLDDPFGGEVYKVGQSVTIDWRSCNVQNVTISMVYGGHDMGLLTKTAIPASQGSYVWTIPSTATQFGHTEFLISVSSAEKSDVGSTSGKFTIN